MDNICVQRLEALKQIVILNHLNTIDFDQSKNFYDILMEKVFQGDFDYCFLSQSFYGVEEEEKKEIYQLARKYKDLCFYLGDFHYWADSIGGVYASDLDLVSMRVLDHYDFLLGLTRDGGEAVLKLLATFQDSFMSREGSVIDYLRNTFANDDLLKNFLVEMSEKDGLYKELNEEQKRILCTYPAGILYKSEGDSIEKISVEDLVQSLDKENTHQAKSECKTFSDLGDLLLDSKRFEEVVLRVHRMSEVL